MMMRSGLQISVVDPDDDYLGTEIRCWNERFLGTTFVYAGLDELGEFATRIAGFPAIAGDVRTYEFGSRDARIGGGYCGLRFLTLDSAGHSAVEIILEDDEGHFGSGTATLSIPFEAASLDRFVETLRQVERERSGEAILGPQG